MNRWIAFALLALTVGCHTHNHYYGDSHPRRRLPDGAVVPRDAGDRPPWCIEEGQACEDDEDCCDGVCVEPRGEDHAVCATTSQPPPPPPGDGGTGPGPGSDAGTSPPPPADGSAPRPDASACP